MVGGSVTLTVGSLFSGIGGMDLGLERAGFEVKWQVENDPYAVRVLEKHWPDVTRYEDIKEVDFGRVERVDLVAGGFPCQDVSHAGPRVGITGARSGLWREFARALRILRPRFALVENVTGLTDRGLANVLADLAALGFHAEWSVVSACAVGAPHTRERLFVVAYAQSGWARQLRWLQRAQESPPQRDLHWAAAEPPIARMAYGIPNRLERIRGLGNAVVPQVAEWIGHRIMEFDTTLTPLGEIPPSPYLPNTP